MMLFGTLAGLVLKYLLDKRWIFADRETGAAAHGRKFTLYTLMGVVTTAIFWGTETAFWLATGSHAMREYHSRTCVAMQCRSADRPPRRLW